MPDSGLTERECFILEAVVNAYIATARPVGSRALSLKSGLGLSAATIRNTIGDLEEKGYLQKPHTSAGRVPTDKAYRMYVDTILRCSQLSPAGMKGLRRILEDPLLDKVLSRAAQALGVITHELGVGIFPRVAEGVLERVDLIRVSSERIMLVLTIQHGLVKTIFIEVGSGVDDLHLDALVVRLNERLCGLTLSEIRKTAGPRLREALADDDDPLNIFIQSADTLFELDEGESELILGEASELASQPEFRHENNLRSLIFLTDKKHFLLELMKKRVSKEGLYITIGSENEVAELANFTLITDTYRMGKMRGIIGVIGPTRMSYNRVISVVNYTSRLLSEMLGKQ